MLRPPHSPSREDHEEGEARPPYLAPPGAEGKMRTCTLRAIPRPMATCRPSIRTVTGPPMN